MIYKKSEYQINYDRYSKLSYALDYLIENNILIESCPDEDIQQDYFDNTLIVESILIQQLYEAYINMLLIAIETEDMDFLKGESFRLKNLNDWLSYITDLLNS